MSMLLQRDCQMSRDYNDDLLVSVLAGKVNEEKKLPPNAALCAALLCQVDGEKKQNIK